MRIATTFMVVFCLATSLCMAASDSGKSTPAPDKRLDQKVTVRAIGVPLGDFLTDLSAKTGVKMTARRDVADDKLALVVKDVPLSELQDGIKEVLHVRCSRSGKDGEWEWEFWMDQKARDEAEQFRQKELKQLRSYVNDMIADSKLTPEQLKKKHPDNEYDAPDADAPLENTVFGLYESLDADLQNRLWSTDKLVLQGRSLSPSLRESLLAQIDQLGASEADRDGFGMPESWSDIDSVGFGIDEDQSGEMGMSFQVLVSGKSKIKAPDGTEVTGDTQRSMCFMPGPSEKDRDRTRLSDDQVVNAGVSGDKHLKLDIKKPVDAYELLCRIADAADISIVSNYFTHIKGHEFRPNRYQDGRDQLPWVLSDFASQTNSTLVLKNRTLLISNLRWATLRAGEIPERLEAKWKAAEKSKDGLGLEDNIEISRLKDVQLKDLHLYGLGDGKPILHNRKTYAFLSSLTEGQMAAMQSEQGLALSEMDQTQNTLVEELSITDELAALILRNNTSTANRTPFAKPKAFRLSRVQPTKDRPGVVDWKLSAIEGHGEFPWALLAMIHHCPPAM